MAAKSRSTKQESSATATAAKKSGNAKSINQTMIKIFLRRHFPVVFGFLFSVFLSSCDRNVVFEKNIELPENRWEINNIIKLDAEIKDTISLYNIYINVRNAGGYQFSNLYLFLNTRTPKGVEGRDTVELTLADERGKWLGNGSGDIWDNRILLKRKFRFPESGMYHFEMQQAMRINPLPQIMDAGLRIEKTE
jgi:gliding motility-associated lipoprotein GldH